MTDPRDVGDDALDEAGSIEMDGEELFRILQEERAEHFRVYEELAGRPDYLPRLRRAAAEFLAEPEQFSVGDVVTWKSGLRNKRFPAYGRPAVVVGIDDGALSDEDDSASPRYREPEDLSLGIIDGDGDFEVFRYDRRRFTTWSSATPDPSSD